MQHKYSYPTTIKFSAYFIGVFKHSTLYLSPKVFLKLYFYLLTGPTIPKDKQKDCLGQNILGRTRFIVNSVKIERE